MAEIIATLRFLVAFTLIIKVTSQRCYSNICDGKSNGNDDSLVSYFVGKHNQSTRLNTSNILETHSVPNEKLCMKKCHGNTNCFSINFCEDSTCELLSENSYSHQSEMVKNSSWNHTSVASEKCDRQPCLNHGKCSPHYNNNSFACICARNYNGTFCETHTPNSFDELGIARPSMEFLFEEDTKNTGEYTSFVMTKSYGRTVHTGDRLGKVFFVDETGNGASFEAPTEEVTCMTTNQCPDGFTLSFWVKISRWNIKRTATMDDGQKKVVIMMTDHGIMFEYVIFKNQFWIYFFQSKTYSYAHLSKSIKPHVWNHIIIQQTAEPNIERGLYLNGVYFQTREFNRNVPSKCPLLSSIFFAVNCYGNPPPQGRYYVDDFRYWRKALTDDEIRLLMEEKVI